MSSTKAQTGLSIARNGVKFSFSWKLAETYGAQQYRAKTSAEKWKSVAQQNIGVKVTAKSISINKANYYPNTSKKLTSVSFAVRARGYEKDKTTLKKWSESSVKDFTINIPNVPSLTATPSDSLGNTCTFTWNTATSETDTRIFTNVEYQAILVANSNEADGSKLSWKTSTAGWRTGTGNASGSITIPETNSDIASGSHTRWFRVRSRGPAGASAWRYVKRVYAIPNAPTINSVKATKRPGGHEILTKWTAPASNAFPVETMDVEKVVVIPAAGLTVPAGTQFDTELTVRRTGASNAGSYIFEQSLNDDEVLFTRIRSHHVLASNVSRAEPTIIGNLAAPVITNVQTEESTHRATITATNASTVPDSFLVVLYRTASSKTTIVGIIPHGETSVTVQCPNWNGETGVAFGVYACVGTYTEQPRADGVSSYAVTVKMRSKGEVWRGGTVPETPDNVSVFATDVPGTIRVTWDWAWENATSTIISWADHADAWESTDEPDEYEVTNLNAAQWNVSGLETGKKWYVRLRFKQETAEATVYSAWSDTVEIDLSSAPAIPVLALSQGVITESVTAYWAYVSGDGTNQAYAEICEATIENGVIVYGEKIAETQTAQHITLYVNELGWDVGETHYLCVRVSSASGRLSDGWSAPVPVTVAEPLVAEITQTSLVEETITEGEETRTVLSLTEMPMTATITGAGAGGQTTLIIERAEDYHVDRPDETSFNGYEGETIFIYTQTGESEITVNRDDLLGSLDDGARYRLIGTVQDGLGQSAEAVLEFEVHWTHQAVIPEATAYIQGNVAVITATQPEGYAIGDTCDIYRLSANRPELIVQDAEFGVQYVDPYPAIGEYGGHRVVYKTADGDYITEDKELAWLDLGEADGDILKSRTALIDFNGETIELFYDMSHSLDWSKEFKETRYLGGAIQGDWNKGVSISSSVGASMVTVEDADAIRAMRRLSVYEGLCHIRTLDGSSFACDIQVSESRDNGGDYLRASFSLSITRVDPQGFEGQKYDDYFTE